MTSTQTLTTDSFKEVTNRNHSYQPGLEAVYLPPQGVTFAVNSVPLPEKPVAVPERRKLNFWLFLAVGILGLAVIGLAIGLGVGLSREHDSDSDSSQSPATQDSDTNSSISLSPTPTNSDSNETFTTTITRTATASATSTPSPSSPCPSGNNTITSPSLGSIRYRIHCDSDVSGGNKITLSSIVVDSFDACVALCNTMNYFQERTDVAATYNVAGTGTQTPGTCWCLGGEGIEVSENIGLGVG
ncbi:hypothetical protein BJY01DRAFT_253712 [Aspergillus pseudoustus]|uniref:WSC domain-containing protein n=1 Tax=Aspergillus pseudoustus TaxID=1810923 RepID=A0ABR4J105_9EURO